MTDPSEVGQALEALAEALDALAVPWAVCGSLASAAHGEPRATNDIDVVAVLGERQARELVARLGESFYADADAAADAARRRSSFNIVDTRSFIKLDLFVPPPGPLGEGQLTRRVHLDLFPGVRAIPVLGPEDIVLQKLRWYLLGGETSDRQWRDVVSVLRIRGSDLDARYLDGVAAAAGLAAPLERARRDAADEPS